MLNSFKKFRFGARLWVAFWQKHKFLIATGIAIGTISFFYFSSLQRSLSAKPTQRIGLVGKFTTAQLPLEIQQLITDGLTSTLPNGEARPSLAESWEVNQEGKEYIFTLRNDIFWQTGKPVLAEDINYNFNDVASTVIDKKSLKFELKEPFTPFPVVVSRPVFLDGLIGTGAYKVDSVTRNGQIIEKLILKRTKDASKPALIYRFYPTESVARTAYKLGEVDVLKELSDPKELGNWSSTKITTKVNYSRFAGVFFNTQSEKFGEKSVRQALAYAINKNWKSRALNPINPHSWAYNPDVKPYNFDLNKAKNLLQKATEENEKPLLKEVELSTTPSLLPIADEIKKDWEQLDLEIKIKIINNLDEPFEALLIIQEIPPDPDLYVFWHSTQIGNISRYKSPKIDNLLEEGRKTLDKEERKNIYADLQRFLTEDTPVIFLFHPTIYTVSR